MTVILEKWNDSWAQCETITGHIVLIRKGKLPSTAKEGNIFGFSKGVWRHDFEGEERRRARVRWHMDDLFI